MTIGIDRVREDLEHEGDLLPGAERIEDRGLGTGGHARNVSAGTVPVRAAPTGPDSLTRSRARVFSRSSPETAALFDEDNIGRGVDAPAARTYLYGPLENGTPLSDNRIVPA